MNKVKKKVVISNNDCKYIFLFKKNLIKALIENGYSVTVVAPKDEFSHRICEIGADHYPITMNSHSMNPFREILTLISMFRAYKRLKPFANLVFTIKPNIYGTIASSFLKINTINNITGLGSNFIGSGINQAFIKILYRFALRVSSKVFFQNHEDRDLFVDQNLVDVQKTILIPGSGVDIDRFKPIIRDIRPDSPFNKCIFLMIGRILVDKGVLEYIEAARIIKNSYKGSEFLLLGSCDSGNSSAINIETVMEWNEEGTIKYLGEVADVRPLISRSDVVVLPSYREGMPRVLLEALAMERPIIGSDAPGCRSIVDDGVNGYLCKIKDANDLAHQMEKMILHSDYDRNKMGKNGRNTVVNKFDEQIVINTYIDTIKSFLK